MTQKIVAFKPFNDQLIFFNPYSNKFEEVPGGAPHGRGFTINEVFHRVREGQDITELVECVHEELLERAKAGAQFFKKSAGISKRTTGSIGDPKTRIGAHSKKQSRKNGRDRKLRSTRGPERGPK